MSAVLVALSAHVPPSSLGFMHDTTHLCTSCLPSISGCRVCPNHHHHHYEVNHQNGLKTKELGFPTRLQGFIPNGAFIGALHRNMDGNSHRYTDWCPVTMRHFAINWETLDWSRFRSVILNVGCLETISVSSLFISEQNDLTVGIWSQRVT